MDAEFDKQLNDFDSSDDEIPLIKATPRAFLPTCSHGVVMADCLFCDGYGCLINEPSRVSFRTYTISSFIAINCALFQSF